MNKFLALTVAIAGAALASQANAAPLSKADGFANGAGIVNVDWRRDRDRDRDHDRRHWRRGDYESHGWRRFERRPHDWRRRSCVAVGPVWFCP